MSGFRIINNNPQNRVKDCYAPAPAINLTLRSNGEEPVQVVDCLGNLPVAGLIAPLVAPTVTDNGTAGTWIANQHWAYLYVYVAKNSYPLVQNAVTGGGSPAPRSNPSPFTLTDSVTNTHQKLVQLPPSVESNIDAVWIYRTGLFSSTAEAQTNAQAGNAFFIAEVLNNPNFVLLSFVDDAAIIPTTEQVEEDNFVAPIFQNCIYADPYFWGFGNNQLTCAVSIVASGLVTITDSTTWFIGRNAQTINFVGVTNGGFDGHGNYYFKFLTNKTAQVYTNIGLTNLGTISVAGTTQATVTGRGTTLYRSKPRNPFSWGETDLINSVEVPSLYNFTVGGGIGTAIAVIPNLNLLKLDTEGPNKCFTLNLKYAGTSNFEPSLREIAANSVSTQHVQFTAMNKNGLSVIWGLDTKSFAILECDGSNQSIISDNVVETLHSMALGDADRVHFTGVYCPRLEMNCFFLRTSSVASSINLLIYYHWPTDQWGTILLFDALCATQILDPQTNEFKLIIGTSTGFIGELFNPNTFINWYNSATAGFGNTGFGLPSLFPKLPGIIVDPTVANPLVSSPGCEGNWITVISYRRFPMQSLADAPAKFYCRISSIGIDSPSGNQVIFIDQVMDSNFLGLDPISTHFEFSGTISTNFYYLGINEIEIGKFFTLTEPFDHKQLDQLLTTWNGVPLGNPTIMPTVQLGSDYQFEAFVIDPANPSFGPEQFPLAEVDLQALQSGSPDTQSLNVLGLPNLLTQCTIAFSRVFGFVLRDRNTAPVQLINFEFRLNATDLQPPRPISIEMEQLQNYAPGSKTNPQ